MRTQGHDGESFESPVGIIVISDSHIDMDTKVETVTRLPGTPDYVGTATANSKADPLEDTDTK